MKLTGTTVFITGGAGGIGSAFARSLVQNGAQVCIADVDEPRGKKLTEDLNKEFGTENQRAIFLKCDVTDSDEFKEAFEKARKTFNHVDIMVNNAGVHDETSLEKMLAINLNGTITGTNLAFSHMRKDKGGKGGVIINMASILGLQPRYDVPVYSASKSGIIGFTRAMATTPDIKDQGVRFACICPNVTDTPLLNLKPHQIREGYFKDVEHLKDQVNISPRTVAEGLLSLIVDDDSNDTLLQITLEEGIARKMIKIVDI